MVGLKSAEVLKQYPLSRFEGSPQKAFLQVDADSMVICPSYQLLGRNFCLCISTGQVVTFCEACFLQPRLLQYTQAGFCCTEWDACVHFENLQHLWPPLQDYVFFVFFGCQAAGIPSWAFQFAHFIPSQRPDGWGCSNGPELDVAPPSRGAYTTLSQTESWSCRLKTTATEPSKPLGLRKLFAIHGDDAAWCHFFWLESNWFNSHHHYSSLFIIYTSVALLTSPAVRFAKSHRGEVRFWKRSWPWWTWTSQQQDCMYFFTWGANAEWKDPLLGNISVGEKNICLAFFVYLFSSFWFDLQHFSIFSLRRFFPNFSPKMKFHDSQVLVGLPSLPLENLLLGPNILEKQRWLQL